MFKFLTQLFDDRQRKLEQYQKIVDGITALEPEFKKLSDAKLSRQTQAFRQRIAEYMESQGFNDYFAAASQAEHTFWRTKSETDPQLKQQWTSLVKAEKEILTQLLPEVFATVREVSRRVLGLRHFDVQLVAGIGLHEGYITEQRTGEGKTLTVTAPLYLNALLGKGAHLVTVNDYLAEVGVGWMGPIYHFLGMTSAVIVHDKARLYDPEVESEIRGDERLEHFREISRKEAYASDVTYGTNNEFGFDYLRDNMVQQLSDMVQRTANAHHFAIVDEADSILIDEARTPLIISAPDAEPTKKYYDYARMVQSLVQDQDFTLDEKARTVTLTDLGVKRIEQKLGVKNLYEESFDTIHHVESALKAKTLYHRDQEYIIRENQVIIVDEHTGRLMYGRRYSDGLHQSIEAKEGVPIQQESRTLATISLQNYFRLYQKLAGMTGTAATEAEEFHKIYKVDVLVIPTHRPMIRQDKMDVIYKTTAAKYSAIARLVEEIHQTGRPILIGTRSIDHNQVIANFLSRKNIPHQVLNAKNNEKEAFIIADAGKKGAITVATNIAGRGVDIVLGGAKPDLKDYRKKNKVTEKIKTPAEFADLGLPASVNAANYKLKEYAAAVRAWRKAHDEVVNLGGLYIIGTERHESRRIDNQLRGRAGRQGDAGTSLFFIALDDDVMRIFGGDGIKKAFDFLQIEDDQPIEHNMVSKSIESAQVRVEGFFFDQRKRLVEFDDVMNKHRDVIYRRRRRLLEQSAQTLRAEIMDYLRDEIQSLVAQTASLKSNENQIDYHSLVKDFSLIIPFDEKSLQKMIESFTKQKDTQNIEEKLFDIVEKTYDSRENQLGKTVMRELEKMVVMTTIDQQWMDHLDQMDDLREGIWLRGDKNTVLSEYQKEAFSLFEGLIGRIESSIARQIFRWAPMQASQAQSARPVQLIKEDIHESLDKEVADASLPQLAAAPRKTKGSTGDLASALANATSKAKPPGASQIKIGRNDLCPCGSGLKYKKCGLIGAPQHRS